MAFGLNGERVRLVPLDEARHLENYYQWLNDYELTDGIIVKPPITMPMEKDFFANFGQAKGHTIFAIELLDGTHIGSSGVHNINNPIGTANTGSFIGTKELWGKGYATEANRLRAWYCFHVLGLRVIYSEYLDGNSASKRMQEKVGYLPCGVRPAKYWYRGRYRDEHLTFLTRERWLELYPEHAM